MNLLLGIIVGVLLFALFLWINRKLIELYRLNPLLGLGGIYFAFYMVTEKAHQHLPQFLTTKQIDTPFQLQGTLGFFFHLKEPKMSLLELILCVFYMCLVGYFIYAFGIKKSKWGAP
ncbi:MAG: hypothetical protein NXH86_06450 [Flavobacteriaceae bacterium]|uniref:hypothetical protein n=1 Tax=Flagellimonas sp. SN16 TaxID=3415142 RepID=UPI003C43DD1F|nr:hypothetical protein [Flavobacteriaceae bacterium]